MIGLADWYFQTRVEAECERYNTIKRLFKCYACKGILQGETNVPVTAIWVIENVLQY
jgi:hypothetical protein